MRPGFGGEIIILIVFYCGLASLVIALLLFRNFIVSKYSDHWWGLLLKTAIIIFMAPATVTIIVYHAHFFGHFVIGLRDTWWFVFFIAAPLVWVLLVGVLFEQITRFAKHRSQ